MLSENPVTVVMDAPVTLVAEFVDLGDAVGLDLVADLGDLLVATGDLVNAADVTNLQFDRGGDGAAVGNQVPDAAEFMVLEAVLADARYDRTPFGGVGHQTVYAAWAANLAQAELDLATALPAVQRAVAAYMTLGTEGHTAWAQAAALEVSGVTLDAALYTGAPHLGALGDADGDGTWNRLEWVSVLDFYQVTTPTMTEAGIYVEWALDPTLPDPIDIGLDLADGDGTNWDYSYLPQGTVTFYSAQDLPIEIRILDPPGREDVPVTIGQPVQIPLGAELLIKLADGANADWFYTWSAEGQMINGSAEKTERFRLMRSGTIVPKRRTPNTIKLPPSPTGDDAYTLIWSGVGPYGHLVTAGQGSGGNFVDVPQGAFLKVRAYKLKEAPGGYNNAGDNKQFATSYEYLLPGETARAYGSPAFNFEVVTGLNAPSFSAADASNGWWTHSASAGDGGFVGIGRENNSGPFEPQNGGILSSVSRPKPLDGIGEDFRIHAFAFPGFEILTWGGNVPQPPLGTEEIVVAAISPTSISAVANFGEMLTLSAEVVVDGTGGGTPAEAGHVSADPAQKYYTLLDTTYVQLDASVHVGYYFTHWTGDGVAYPNAGLFGGDAPDLDNPMPLNNPEAPVTDDVIWIAMEADESGGEKAAGTGGGANREVVSNLRSICEETEGSGQLLPLPILDDDGEPRTCGGKPYLYVTEISDDCGNTIEIDCDGACFFFKYNGTTFGICEFIGGNNALFVEYTKHSTPSYKRFFQIWHLTADDGPTPPNWPPGEPLPEDDNGNGKWDFILTKLNAITGTVYERCCRKTGAYLDDASLWVCNLGTPYHDEDPGEEDCQCGCGNNCLPAVPRYNQ